MRIVVPAHAPPRTSTGRAIARLAAAFIFLVAGPGRADAQSIGVATKVAEDVYVIRHRELPFEGGNTTIVIGDRDVLVVDACQFPYVAREDIAAIKRLTSKPVRYVVNTHWHNDHVMGNHDYMIAYPAVAIVAQRETKRDMDLNDPRSAERESLAPRLDQYTRWLATGKDDSGNEIGERNRALLSEAVPRFRLAVDDLKSFVYESPTLVFDDSLDVDLGHRPVRIRHFGRGNTNGDAVVYVPSEKVLISGDLLVTPMPFFVDGYPSEWVHTLERLAQLDAQIIVPGHGEVMHDKTFLNLMHDLLESAVHQLDAKIAATIPAWAQSDSVARAIDLTPFRVRFAGNDAGLARRFDQMARELAKLVFKEATLR
jgi:glyoxylase-like metal-dependent hydrolase (beta-lactamase superfamily II)